MCYFTVPSKGPLCHGMMPARSDLMPGLVGMRQVDLSIATCHRLDNMTP